MVRSVDEKFIRHLQTLLGKDIMRPLQACYRTELRGLFYAEKGLVVCPENTEQVAHIVEICAAEKVAIVPFGGGTGLVGGQIAHNRAACVILSLEKMNKIRAVWPEENILHAEAGVVLYNLRAEARRYERLFALWIGAGKSCQIGGNLATNAGGINVLRYGMARDQILGIEAVLPNGHIMHGLSRLYKDNTGYDLSNLMIGSEGTLGVITAAALKLHHLPKATGVALLSVNSPQDAVALLSLAQEECGNIISAFELMSETSFEFIAEIFSDVTLPFGSSIPKWSVLIEIGLSNKNDDPDSYLTHLFARAQAKGLSYDGIIARSRTQSQSLWHLRELMPEANRKIGAISSHDIAVPLSEMGQFVQKAERMILEIAPLRINCFGHVGDGNLHFNVFPPRGKKAKEFSTLKKEVQNCIYACAVDLNGSISAEHGIGRLKNEMMVKYCDATELAFMRKIKKAFDPHNIMNPGVIFCD